MNGSGQSSGCATSDAIPLINGASRSCRRSGERRFPSRCRILGSPNPTASATWAMGTDLATSSLSKNVAMLLVAPQLILAVSSIVLIGLGWMNRNPFWSPTILTLSEETALRDQATVLVLIEGGADPEVPYRIRAGLTGEREMVVTPMQAAIGEDRAEMAALLLSHGLKARVGQVCEWLGLAEANDKKEVMSYLRSTFRSEEHTSEIQSLRKL